MMIASQKMNGTIKLREHDAIDAHATLTPGVVVIVLSVEYSDQTLISY